MRREFQVDVGPVLPLDGFHRRGKQDGLADVLPPVGAVQPLRRLSRHRRYQRHFGVKGALVQKGQDHPCVVLERIHGAGVEGDIALKQPILQVTPVQFLHDGPQGRLFPVDDGAGRRVLTGDPNLPVFPGSKGNA